MSKKEKYELEMLSPESRIEGWDSFVDRSPQGSLFCKSWWLKAACQNNYEILVLRQKGAIVAGLPLPFIGSRRYKIVSPPCLSTAMGVLLEQPLKTDSYEQRLSREMDLLGTLTESIPPFREARIICHPQFTNWMPFYWAGYSQTTFYTYVIEDLTDLNRVFSGFNYAKIKNIRKAEKMLTVKEDMPASDFYQNHVMTLRKQGSVIFHRYDRFKNLYDAAYARHAGKTWYATDPEQNIHAAIFVVFDKNSAYYLVSSIDPDFRNSGASTLLLREALTYVSRYTNRFDFEGSMLRGVESSFRKFGAVQTPYFCLTKGNTLGSKSQRLLERILRKLGLME